MATGTASRLWNDAKAAVAGRTRQRGEPASRPVAGYLDEERFRRELALLRTFPVPVAPLAQLAKPGDWATVRAHGVPVLLARAQDGILRAFINVCRHRGATVAPEDACGAGKQRFVCPYHSWTYDCLGANVGRPHDEEFPHVPRGSAGLVPLPCTERLGLAWVVPSAVAGFDWHEWFGPLGGEVEALGYSRDVLAPHARKFAHPSNWKLVVEGNLESYHFQYAHRETISHLFHDNMVVQEQLGDHQRIVLPKRSMAGVDDAQASAALLGRHSHVIYYLFPCTLLLWEGDHINIFGISPTGTATSEVNGWLLVPPEHAHRDPAHWALNHELFWKTLDEDFALAASIQGGLESGANVHLNFGTGEFACEAFNQSLDRHLAG